MRGKSPPRCLIMAGSPIIGHQIASLVAALGWQTDVVHDDIQARDHILTEAIDIVIADIDTVDLGGLAILAFCHHRYPALVTYAIAHAEDEYGKKMGRDAGGCQGYFYLEKGKMQIDLSRGMAAELVAGITPIG